MPSLTRAGRSNHMAEIEAMFSQDTGAPNPEDYFIMSPANGSSIQDMLDFEIKQGNRGCVERTDMDHLPASIKLGNCNPCEDPLVISATVWKNGKIGPLEYYYIKDTSNFCTVPGNHHVAIGVGVGALIVAVAVSGYLIYRYHNKIRVGVQALVSQSVSILRACWSWGRVEDGGDVGNQAQQEPEIQPEASISTSPSYSCSYRETQSYGIS